MRCIRESSQAKCNRCLVASADCIFSVARKAGRPPSTLPKAISRRSSTGQQPLQQPSPARSSSGNFSLSSSSQDEFARSLLEDYPTSSLFSDALSESTIPTLDAWSDGLSGPGNNDVQDFHELWLSNYLAAGTFDQGNGDGQIAIEAFPPPLTTPST
ncbi:uncharacterized protein BDZ99DRAFT_458262 [Mytilinidion resinicola]|uniref:Zn(2)-C6 fungal-type domain-containing protein n=1 Tax=Mytilinidion resinicola TaxID=574789 RepID=A0A6A6Z5L0_9PEZI|nr:uncharacterized protein BDZ99DRAFT_458262 [Mytilinidion resinicola]KAF2816386.1 hypothetical protein BDZ99DRAFT_458262 [Mytilinidion resinicola]